MDSSNEQLDRLNLLYEKLKSSQVQIDSMKPQEQSGAKLRLRNVQSLIMKFYSEIEQSNQDRDNRVEMMTDRLYKLQASLQDDMSKRGIKCIYICSQVEKVLAARLTKVQKHCKKALEGVTKERNEMDKKIQSSLQGCLLDINTHRTRQQGECNMVVKEMLTLIPEVQDLQLQVEGESVITKEILKKIYNQFSEQIDELKQMIDDQKADRQTEEESLLKKLQDTYLNVHSSILLIKKSREKSEKMLVDLLERVIEKVKNELANG